MNTYSTMNATLVGRAGLVALLLTSTTSLVCAQEVLPLSACLESPQLRLLYKREDYQGALDNFEKAEFPKGNNSHSACETELELRLVRLQVQPPSGYAVTINGAAPPGIAAALEHRKASRVELAPAVGTGPRLHIDVELLSPPQGLSLVTLTPHPPTLPPPPLRPLRIAFPKSVLSGARVEIDGKEATTMNAGELTLVDVPAGDHEVHARPPTRQAWASKVRVTPLETIVTPNLSPRLVVAPPAGESEAPPPVTIDERPDTVVPMTPGRYRVAVARDGHRAWRAAVVVPADGTADVQIVPEQEPVAPAPGHVQRTVAFALAGVAGVAGVGAAYFARASIDADEESDKHCGPSIDPDWGPNTCDDEGLELDDKAALYSDVATVSGVVGGLALLGGVVLYLTAPDGTEEQSVRVGVASGDGKHPTGFAIQATGTW